jgi:Na+/H+-dicarboxylate symporter
LAFLNPLVSLLSISVNNSNFYELSTNKRFQEINSSGTTIMTTHTHVHKPNRQTLYVVIALLMGVVVGELLNLTLGEVGAVQPDSSLSQIIAVFTVLTDIFLRLVKMIIAPLVISTLVVGMAKMGDINTVGRIGIKALLWFFSASLFSLLLGMLLVNLLEPGSTLHIALPDVGAETGLPDVKPTLSTFAAHIFPKSVVEAMANNEILQIVVFSMFLAWLVPR